MANTISNKDVAKAKQILKDARSDSGSAKSISNKDIEILKGARSDSGSANSISNRDIEIAKMILRGEENNPDGDGFRNGGKVSLGKFKGYF